MSNPETGPLLSAGFWLHQAALTWRAELDARLRPLGLTHTQFMLLASVGWLEYLHGPPTQQEIAEQADADRMMTSKIVRTLEGRGLLTRRADESDARALRVALTTTGRGLAAQATAQAREVDALFFGPDAHTLKSTLRGLAEQRRTEG